MRVIALIDDKAVICKALSHLGLRRRYPRREEDLRRLLRVDFPSVRIR